MKYFEVVLNHMAEGIWFPESPTADGEEVDPRDFCECRPWQNDAELSLARPSGTPGNFALGELDYPLLDANVADAVAGLDARVQHIPLRVDGMERRFVILNVLRLIDCVDEEASVFERFELTGSRPDLAGQYKVFYKLRLHPTVISKNAHIFRVSGYDIALIVSAKKELLEERRANDGIRFVPVT